MIKISKINFIVPGNLAHLTPRPREKVELFLNYPTAICNGIRRCLIEELPLNVLFTKLEDIVTDDSTPNDLIKHRLKLIPIDQSIPDSSKFKFEITNNDTEIIPVYARDIPGLQKYVDPGYRIMTLGPKRSLLIKKITLEKQTGFDPDSHSIAVYDVIYQKKDDGYYMSFKSNGTIPAREILPIVCDNISARLAEVVDFFNGNPVRGKSFSETTPQKLIIDNESYTIGNIITFYTFELDPSIELVNCDQIHPTDRRLVINIKHPKSRDLLKAACEKAIKVFDEIKRKAKK